jgi:CspA family cold shock protein
MTFRDTRVTCDKCDKEFILTVEEQRRTGTTGEEGVANECPACQGRKPRSPEPDQGQVQQSLDPGQGAVKWYDPEKGYGFLARHTGEEVFFHRTGVIEEDHRLLVEGARVTYELGETDKGLQATNVALLEE